MNTPKFPKKALSFAIFTVAFFLSFFLLNYSAVSASDYALTIIAGDKTYYFSHCETSVYKGKKYLNKAAQVVEGIYFDTLVPPQNAELVFSPDDKNVFSVNEEKNGVSVNTEKLLSDVNRALNNNTPVVKAEFITLYPDIYKKDVLKNTFRRASFSTSYAASSDGRKHNIALAAKKLNGIKIPIDEEFSFNNAVGARSVENGFKTAKIILNGEFADGVGGGVCQVSSTIYNCALLSGLTVTEQHSHSLSVGYVEPSFDAMVNSYTSDLKFLNDTGGDVYVAATADGTTLSFTFYGVMQTETYERISVTKETILPEPAEIVSDDSLRAGETKTVRACKNGLKSEGYLIKYSDGKRVKTIKIRSDKYNPVRGKILISPRRTETIEGLL